MMSASPTEWLTCYPAVNSGKALLVVHSLDGILDTGIHGALRCLCNDYIKKYMKLHLEHNLEGMVFFHKYKSTYWMGLTIKQTYDSEPSRDLLNPLLKKLKFFAEKNDIESYLIDSTHASEVLIKALDEAGIKYEIVESNENAYFENLYESGHYKVEEVK